MITERLARSSAPVLITGETGTGKEVAALAIHNASGVRGQFVAVNCAALPDSLAESELFGHVRGAFTGAAAERVGAFEQAAHGTLFLDEIGDAPRVLQAKLLRAIESGTVTRVGSGKPVAVNARIVCATNVDLVAAVERGAFRPDLLHRIDVLRVSLPPLRDRDDFEDVCRSVLARVNAEQGTACTMASTDWLRAHSWPGNIRELRNTLTRLVVERGEGGITGADIGRPSVGTGGGLATIADVEALQERLVEATLARNKWNVAAAARDLGLKRTTLREQISKHNRLNEMLSRARESMAS